MIRFCLVVVVIGSTFHKTASEPNATSVTPSFVLADCPLWIDSDKTVYLIDAINYLLVSYKSGTTTTVPIGVTDPLKFLIHVSGKKAFLIGFGRTVGVFPWNGLSEDTLSAINSLSLTDDQNVHIECGKVDPEGRLWIGTSFQGDDLKGRFYSVDSEGKVTPQLDIGGPPVGIAWNLAYDKVYYSDKTKRGIVKCSFDLNSGTISNDGSIFFDFAANQIKGYPKGITIDTVGNLWVACFNSDKVLKIDAMAGTVMTTITLPGTTSITSAEFGGDSSEKLYVTTANDQNANPGFHENAGKLFEVTGTGVEGVGPYDMDVKWPQAT